MQKEINGMASCLGCVHASLRNHSSPGRCQLPFFPSFSPLLPPLRRIYAFACSIVRDPRAAGILVPNPSFSNLEPYYPRPCVYRFLLLSTLVVSNPNLRKKRFPKSLRVKGSRRNFPWEKKDLLKRKYTFESVVLATC